MEHKKMLVTIRFDYKIKGTTEILQSKMMMFTPLANSKAEIWKLKRAIKHYFKNLSTILNVNITRITVDFLYNNDKTDAPYTLMKALDIFR